MKHLTKKIERIMDEDTNAKLTLASSVMRGFSIGYEAVVKILDAGYRRGILASERLPCPVVSIGNICVGGTGKTPMTIHAAKALQEKGLKVCILSRGYKGGSENNTAIVSDGNKLFLNGDKAGDEALMMAKILPDVPVVVGKNRFRSGLVAINAFQPDIILLDDGFQHRKLFRDIDVVLLDEQRPFGNGRLIPAGRLRELPPSLKRADAVVFTRSRGLGHRGQQTHLVASYVDFLRVPVFYARHKPFLAGGFTPGIADPTAGGSEDLSFLQGKTVFAFSGIARNDDFKNTIETLGATVSGTAFFPDHHAYANAELDRIARSAKELGVDIIATTQKDHVRVSLSINWPVHYIVIGIKIDLEDQETAFGNFLFDKIFASPASRTSL